MLGSHQSQALSQFPYQGTATVAELDVGLCRCLLLIGILIGRVEMANRHSSVEWLFSNGAYIRFSDLGIGPSGSLFEMH